MAILGLTAEAERQAADELWRQLCAGMDDDEIRAEMGLDHGSYRALRTLAVERATDTLRQQPQELVFADYLVCQMRCIRELSDMIRAWSSRDEDGRAKVNQPAAYVSAVRAKSEIVDRILATGKELGMVRVAEDGTLVPGLNLRDMSNTEIRTQIVRELRSLDRLSKKYGDADVGEADPGALYRDAPASAAFGGAVATTAKKA